ncbi:hypothetical protein FALBO_14747 [Fusarium albosuccineum]|uniref:Uncharacterized protein n=1 Tax=Fusarium albosuccineum TaxID=1237068 RepID=A0A8H4KYB3_9HYPO|nr:hypothetical protein FALBO_14747 [Fusarium albosuccineum]
MAQYREIKIVMSSNHNTSTITTNKTQGPMWRASIISPVKSWAAKLFRNKYTCVETEDEFEPLLEEKMMYMPKPAGTSFLRTATLRSTKKYSRMP